jgi:hypothetical protein
MQSALHNPVGQQYADMYLSHQAEFQYAIALRGCNIRCCLTPQEEQNVFFYRNSPAATLH